MKKTFKKLLSILMVFAMLFGMVPTQAFAADETIDTISATVTLPVKGANPVETGTPGDSSYKIIRVSFSEKDPETGIYTSLESTDTFKAGKTYMVNVLFRANSGYAIDRNTVSASINGQTAAWWGAISDGHGSQYFYIEYTVPEDVPAAKTPINFVKVSDITEPVIGATPDFDITLTGEAAFDEEEGKGWWKVEPETYHWELMDEDTPFSAGLYALEVCLKSKAGYEFTDATKFYYNEDELPEYDGSYESNYELWDGGAGIYLYFTLEFATPVQPAVALNESAITLTVGGTATLVPTITPADLPNYALSWKSDDESVATVDSDGKITAVAAGTATITVTLNPNNAARSTETTALPTATCVVTVVPQDVPQEPTTSVTVVKEWDVPDGTVLPESVEVYLLANGVEITYTTLDEDNNWTYTWTELPVAMGSGTPIVYTVDELEVPYGYEKTIGEALETDEGIEIAITNTLKTVTVSGTKTWVGDEENYEVVRPASIIVNLLANGETIGEAEVTAETQWTFYFDELPKYDEAGEEIEYTVQEEEVEGYTVSYDGFNITNTLKEEEPEGPETVTVAGTKTWVGDTEADRPQSIIVNLLANGEVIDETEVTKETQWTYSFGDLPKYKAGDEIEYTVQEEEVDGYTVSYDGFNITNTKDSDEEGGNGGATTPTTPSAPSTPSVPDTSDNTGALMYLAAMAASAVALVFVLKKKRNIE